MSDEHQVNTIIATVISDARKDAPDGRIDPEEAKQIAKCITDALSGWTADRTRDQTKTAPIIPLH